MGGGGEESPEHVSSVSFYFLDYFSQQLPGWAVQIYCGVMILCESQTCLCWEGPAMVILSNSSAVGRDVCH